MPFRKLFQLNKPLSAHALADRDDILNTKRALNRLGLYEGSDEGFGDFTDNEMFDGIKSLQRQWGLEPDGVINPSRETETAMNFALDRQHSPPSNLPVDERPTDSQIAAGDPSATEQTPEELQAQLARLEAELGKIVKEAVPLNPDNSVNEEYRRRVDEIMTKIDAVRRELDQIQQRDKFR